MRRLTPVFLLIACLAALAAAPGFAIAQSPASDVRVTQVDTSSYPEVTIYVAVSNAAGETRPGLQRGDFAVTEDGTPVDITAFQGGGGQINAALVIDRSGSMEEAGKLRGAQAAAQTFVKQMRPTDQTTLLAFNSSSIIMQPLTNRQGDLERAIDRLSANGGTALYDSVIAGVDALRNAGGRRVLLVLTDGEDCRDVSAYMCPRIYGSDASLNEAIDYANQYEQPLYMVGLGDRQRSRSDERGINEAVLTRLSEETYGDYFYAPDAAQLAVLYASLSSSVQDEYMLTYTSPRPFYDGTRRDIQVQVEGVTSAGGYTERHLINVHSHPLVGLVLLLPLVGLLLLPFLVQRSSAARRAPPVSASALPIEEEKAPTHPAMAASHPHQQQQATPLFSSAGSPTLIERPGPSAITTARFCRQCGKPLRPSAKFCGGCGAQIGAGQ